MKNVMAIDPGKRSLGVYINIQGGEDIALTINASKNDTEKQIYSNINLVLRELIKQYDIKVVLCEDYAMSGFKRPSSTSLAEIKGLLKSILYDSSLNVDGLILIPISTWKSTHKALSLPKEKNADYVNKINSFYKKNLQTPDEADAYLIMVSAYLIYKGVVKSNSQLKLQEQLKKIGEIWPIKQRIIEPNKIN